MPTGLVFGADGNDLVTLFSGFPFPKGGAKVVKVTADGVVSDYVTGLSMTIDVRVAPDGGVYAVQFGETGGEGVLPNSGTILRLREGDAEVVVGGLGSPSALSFNGAGDGYVTLLGDGVGVARPLREADGSSRDLRPAGPLTRRPAPEPPPKEVL